ncbi:hypothetical protein EV356DRAFT_529840 [Viridothelium virens]|uniref:NADH-ubiquinone oxidoreductase 9.5 kDa subunit n=1 Tax=Viridothelium virens TaxID=1048519 RepID=A0A6A6HIK5_VIRVR|nr:hypothetical protein EV356DRAFT_529840 [Viridothelium virens]
MSAPYFFRTPIRYMRWAAHEKPAIYYSCIVGALGPVVLAVVPPLRHRFGDLDRPQIPLTYPIPPGPRKVPEGYDD